MKDVCGSEVLAQFHSFHIIIIIEAYPMKGNAFQQWIIFRHHSDTTSRFASSVSQGTSRDKNLKLECGDDDENFSLSSWV